jgi:hypothetical protein
MALFGNPVALAARVAIVALSLLLRNFSIFGNFSFPIKPEGRTIFNARG